jgi:general secretion pathway protein N
MSVFANMTAMADSAHFSTTRRVRQAPTKQRLPTGAPWGWAANGVLLGLLISLLMFAPARWLAAVVSRASGGQLQLLDARGSLWTGSARLNLTGGAGSTDAATLPGRLSWQLRPMVEAAVPGLALQLQADCCLPQPWVWRILPRWGGLQLAFSDHQSHWPAQWLGGLGTPWNTIQPQGQLQLSTQALVLNWVSGRLQVAGLAQVDALDMASRLSTLKPMGSYRFTLAGATTPELRLATLGGPLQLTGHGQWVGNRLRFDGEASSTPESQAALSNLLNIIGRRSGARSIIKVG